MTNPFDMPEDIPDFNAMPIDEELHGKIDAALKDHVFDPCCGEPSACLLEAVQLLYHDDFSNIQITNVKGAWVVTASLTSSELSCTIVTSILPLSISYAFYKLIITDALEGTVEID